MTTKRLTLAGMAANSAVGPLFGWSLVAERAATSTGLSSGGAAGVFAGALVVMALALVATGRAIERLEPRRLLVGAAAAAVGGLVLAASSRQPVGLLLGVSGLYGAANGVAYSVAATLAARVPTARRGTATGLVVACYAAPPVLLGVVGPIVIAEHGWRTCLLALACIAGALLLVAAALAPHAAPRPPGGPHVTASSARSRKGATPWLWVLFAGGAAPALMVFAHAVTLGRQRGLEVASTGLVVSALATGNLLGRVAAGWVSDKVGRFPSLAVAVGAQSLPLAAVTWASGPVAIVGGSAVLGTCYGAVSALVPAATADVVGVSAFPRTFARVFTGWGAAGLTAPILGAAILGLASTTPSMVILTGLPLLPAGLACWVLSGSGGPASSAATAAAGEVRGGEDHL